MKKILNKSISYLNLDCEIEKKLEFNKILIINELWCLDKSYLKNIGFNNDEIKKITIQLQLNGLDLNKKIY